MNEKSFKTGWRKWVRFYVCPENPSEAVGWEAAAKANERGGSRPESVDANEAWEAYQAEKKGLIMAQQPLYLTDEAHVDPRTVAVRWNHPAIASWLGATQHWKWGSEAFGTDGDAIVVVTNHIDEPCFCHVAIRQGHDVRVVKAVGLNDAMRAVGLDPNDFRVM